MMVLNRIVVLHSTS